MIWKLISTLICLIHSLLTDCNRDSTSESLNFGIRSQSFPIANSHLSHTATRRQNQFGKLSRLEYNHREKVFRHFPASFSSTAASKTITISFRNRAVGKQCTDDKQEQRFIRCPKHFHVTRARSVHRWSAVTVFNQQQQQVSVSSGRFWSVENSERP